LNANPEGGLQEAMRRTIENLRNPYTDLYHWVKGELYDLAAFTAALKEREFVSNSVKDINKKIATSKSDIENVTTGKKTMNTLFKNSNDVGQMSNKLEQYERDLVSQEKLLDVLSLYLGRTVLPAFKTEKISLYARMVQQMQVVEISNSHQLASFWSNVLKNPNV